jgi:predicted ester cyclase
LTNRPTARSSEIEQANKATAVRFIEAFNDDGWDTVREVVALNYVFHHPMGGTVQAGPEGMVSAWSGFKASLPDSWHPIPVMIAEGDYIAVLLPTYGHFTGEPYHGFPPTGKWLEYGMVNMVRFEDGKLAEMWFGMDPFAEMQQMGVMPSADPRAPSGTEKASLEVFQRIVDTQSREHDKVAAFDDTVVALWPPQYGRDTTTRWVEVYRVAEGSLTPVYTHEFTTDPPYAGDPSVDTAASRAVAERWINDVLIGHNLGALDAIASPNILVHPTAMPCEASHYGIKGVSQWLQDQWRAFPDLTITDYFTVANRDIVAARWAARGTSQGDFLTLPPTGETVDYTGVSMYRIEDGRIGDVWETRNTFGIMRQLNPEMGGGDHHH